MRIAFVILLVVAISIFGAVNYYIGNRIWQYTGAFLSSFNKVVYWIVFWLVASSYILARNIPKHFPDGVRKFFAGAGGYWMAAMLYFFLLFLLLDLIRFIAIRTGFVPLRIWTSPQVALSIGAASVLLVVSTLAYGTWSAKNPIVQKYEINVDKKAGNIDRINIVVASDMHLGVIVNRDRLSRMVEFINAQNPDLVLLPGDILDDDVETFNKQRMWEILGGIKATYGVFASLGNHEYISNSTEDAVNFLEKSGIKVLQDDYILVNNSFYVVGRNDHSAQRYTGQARKALADILGGADKSMPLFLMDHQPSKLEDAQNNGIDLQVSGHTHRGQMFPNHLITRMVFELDHGYLLKGNTHYVVSLGLGTWGPPIRVGHRPEIANITIKFK